LFVISSILKKAKEEVWFHWPGDTRNSILISSMGRSGSTWLSQIINHRKNFREIFEPFLPVRVAEAEKFEYCQYISVNQNQDFLETAAYRILTGRIRNDWTDKGNISLFSNKQLVKDIRTNLMLNWLKARFPELKIILLIRHPYSVISSWKKLGWGIEPEGERRDLDIILGQEQLIIDFPLVGQAARHFDIYDNITSLALLWSILNYVPLSQNSDNQYTVVRYEDLLQQTSKSTQALFEELNITLDSNKLSSVINRPSKTSYEKKQFNVLEDKLNLTEKVKVKNVVEFFNLDRIYSDMPL
jgi:hypothetical protein